jgi:protease I
MTHTLTGKSIALLATDGFEDTELTKPLVATQEAGATVIIVSNKDGKIVGKDGTQVSVDVQVGDVNAEDFDGLLLPGGMHNPDVMRTEPDAVNFVRDFFEQHKPVAAICHAPWLLAEADVVQDRKLTSWPSLKTDLQNAGAHWVDEEVVTDQGLVTSRKPDDIPAFIEKAIEEFAEGEHAKQTA